MVEFERAWQTSHALDRVYDDEALGLTDRPEQRIVMASAEVWTELIAQLRRDPRALFALPPRKFEELVAELLARDGLRVKLTPRVKDGGLDILAFCETRYGEHLYLVECKRYAPDRPVGVSLVRALYGVVEAEKATAGLLVTTSRSTRAATSFRESVSHRMSLKDYGDLSGWLRRTR